MVLFELLAAKRALWPLSVIMLGHANEVQSLSLVRKRVLTFFQRAKSLPYVRMNHQQVTSASLQMSYSETSRHRLASHALFSFFSRESMVGQASI